MKHNAYLLRYDEIALKGRNRMVFENLLIEGVRRTLGRSVPLSFLRERGRIVVKLKAAEETTVEEIRLLTERLQTVFGLSSFSPGFLVKSDIKAIEHVVYSSFPDHYDGAVASLPDAIPVRYRMRARRSNKAFPFTSNAVEIRFAEALQENYERLKVNLAEADITIGLEIRNDWSFIYYSEFSGPGGMPSGSNDQGLVLLSGGIDSPVASYLAMKRGCPLSFLTFHSYPYTTQESVDKVRQIVTLLNRLQKPGKFLTCNMSESQKMIRDNCAEKYRTILYRRLMLRVAAKVVDYLGAGTIITGDVIGQVASQTISNMATIDHAVNRLVLRPLVGLDKRQIVAWAEEIGTLSISEIDCPDSCTVFAPGSPATRSDVDRIEWEESKLDQNALLSASLETVRIIDPASGDEKELRGFLKTAEAG